jgi:hypothetical protein
MTDLIVVPQAAHWQRLKGLVLDSVSSPITRRVYNLGRGALPDRKGWWRPFPVEYKRGRPKADGCALGPASLSIS